MAQQLNVSYHSSAENYFAHAERSLNRAIQEHRITLSDRKLIEKFSLRLKSAISPCRYMKIVSMLVNVRRYFRVEFSEVDEDDYLDALSNIKYAKRQDGKEKGEPYSQNMIADWMKIVKRFFQFLQKHGLTSVPADVIDQTKPERYDRHTKSDEDVLSIEEINKLIAATNSIMYKAYISLLYELGARSIEIANLKWKDIEVKDKFVSCTIHDTKTNKIRVVPSVAYSLYLLEWRNQYPRDAFGENFVFINSKFQPLKYAAVLTKIKKLAKTAGINKKVTLHIFRHSRITHVLRDGMSETLVKKAFWGNELTNMIDVYGHLTNKDVENEYLRISGVEVPAESKAAVELKTITCPKCLRVNPPGTKFCVCGNCLDSSVMEDVKSNIEKIEDWFDKKSDIEKLEIIKKYL